MGGCCERWNVRRVCVEGVCAFLARAFLARAFLARAFLARAFLARAFLARHSCEGRNPVTLLYGCRDSLVRSSAMPPPACRLRGGRFDRLPPLESLFFCWPKRKVTQREWPSEQGLAASCWDKPERLRMVGTGHPWEAPQRALRSTAQRARIAEDLRRSLAPDRPLLWLRFLS